MAFLPYSNQVVVNSQGAKVGGLAIVSIGTANSTGNPPFPLAPIYSNASGTPLNNPFFADQDGNYTFYAAPGVYKVSIQFLTSSFLLPITLGQGF